MDLCSNSPFNHRTWSDPIDYFCPVSLQLTNRVVVTPEQYTQLLRLVASFENGQINSTELIVSAKQIHPRLQPWRRNELIILGPSREGTS